MTCKKNRIKRAHQIFQCDSRKEKNSKNGKMIEDSTKWDRSLTKYIKDLEEVANRKLTIKLIEIILKLAVII